MMEQSALHYGILDETLQSDPPTLEAIEEQRKKAAERHSRYSATRANLLYFAVMVPLLLAVNWYWASKLPNSQWSAVLVVTVFVVGAAVSLSSQDISLLKWSFAMLFVGVLPIMLLVAVYTLETVHRGGLPSLNSIVAVYAATAAQIATAAAIHKWMVVRPVKNRSIDVTVLRDFTPEAYPDEWCEYLLMVETNNRIEAYQKKIMDQGRLPIVAEFVLARALFMEEEQKNAAREAVRKLYGEAMPA